MNGNKTAKANSVCSDRVPVTDSDRECSSLSESSNWSSLGRLLINKGWSGNYRIQRYNTKLNESI